MVSLSIITATLNNASTIRDCIESVIKQDLSVEHIIIDGGSTDGTLDIIHEYRPHLAKLVSESDKGVYDALNKGIQMAECNIIGLLHADDFYAEPDILSKVASVFGDHNIDACYGDLVYIKSRNAARIVRYWQAGPYNLRRFYWGWMPPHPTFFVCKKIYENYGLFRLDLGSAADYELMLRFLMKYKIRPTYIPEVMVKMRTGGISNASLRNRLLANRNDRLAWKVNGLNPYPWTLFLKPLLKLKQYFVL
jgi:glycosyltransferase involved in cell wall biosynthesis